MKYNLKLVEKTRANKVFISIEYMGGDADTDHFEEYPYQFTYSEIEDNSEIIEKDVNDYKIIQKLTNSPWDSPKYEDVLNEYGKDIADMYDEVPRDPQADYQFKTSLQNVKLVAYDENGNKYEARLI